MMCRGPNKRLSKEQREELERVIRTTREVKIYRRAKVILYKELGYSTQEIEEHTEYSEREQWWWLRRYAQEGLPGLKDRPRSGRPRGPERLLKPACCRAKVPDLEEGARITLEEMHAHHPKPYLRNRALMVLLRAKGYAPATIAEIVGVRVKTVRRVLAAYDRQGLRGLYRRPGSGRPSRLAAKHWQQVKAWVMQGPQAVGYGFVKWTTRSLRNYLGKKWNVTFSREWIRQKLHGLMGFSWTRGKKVPACANQAKRKADRKAFSRQILAKLQSAQQGHLILLFEDETIFTLAGEVGYSWSPKGTTQAVASAGKRERVVVFGASDPLSGQTHYRLEDTINQHTTLRFIQQLVRYYQKHQPGIPLLIVLDKHSGHTAATVQDYVGEQDQVTILLLPTQSADLNPIEHLWHWLSEQMIKNAFFETTTQLKQAVRHFFSYIAGIKEEVISWLGDLRKLYLKEAAI